MTPKVIIHNSISLDGSLTGFDVDMELHYEIARTYGADVHLIGSNTALMGIKLFCPQIPPEQPRDFQKPQRDVALPWWVIPDTTGKLLGMLHVHRRFEGCRDVVLLVSRKTPRPYLRYLEERQYDYHMVGDDRVDYSRALEILLERYHAKTILTDAGRILNGILLNQGLVDEVSLLVHPCVVGKDRYTLLEDTTKAVNLSPARVKRMRNGKVWLVYKVANRDCKA